MRTQFVRTELGTTPALVAKATLEKQWALAHAQVGTCRKALPVAGLLHNLCYRLCCFIVVLFALGVGHRNGENSKLFSMR